MVDTPFVDLPLHVMLALMMLMFPSMRRQAQTAELRLATSLSHSSLLYPFCPASPAYTA
jgi:hypothetical protein